MQTNHNQPDAQLNALLRQMQAPEPRTNFAQNVWRQIRLSEPERTPAPFFKLLWFPKPLAYGLASVAMIASLALGERVGRNVGRQQTDVAIPVLQPQTLAGIYLATHTGR